MSIPKACAPFAMPYIASHTINPIPRSIVNLGAVIVVAHSRSPWPSLVPYQREHLVTLQPLLAAQAGQLHQEGEGVHPRPQELHQLGGGPRRAAGRQQVVDYHHRGVAAQGAAADREVAAAALQRG